MSISVTYVLMKQSDKSTCEVAVCNMSVTRSSYKRGYFYHSIIKRSVEACEISIPLSLCTRLYKNINLDTVYIRSFLKIVIFQFTSYLNFATDKNQQMLLNVTIKTHINLSENNK